MEIDKYNFDDLIDEKYFYKKINDKYYLNDYQISILLRNGIHYECFVSLKELLFEIEDVLLDEDNEELDSVARELEEFYYYHFVNK